jgi:HAE1 family hydrophobic/amphiphilic exporter-1
MLFGTLFGVIIVPGLYFIFGKLQEGRQLIRDEDVNPLTEDFVKEKSNVSLNRTIRKLIIKYVKRNEK